MLIQQAYYGDDGGGHALLAASSASLPFTELAGRTDLPGTAPPGIGWEPYLSGFPWKTFYVLVRTSQDRAARRGGMVQSHALFLPLDEAARWSDLMRPVSLMTERPSHRAAMSPIELEGSGDVPRPGSVPAGLGDLADALVGDHWGPVMWAGQVGFDEAVTRLWAAMRPEFRRSFRFRLSFGPQDCRAPMPAVICTPADLISRWSGYRAVEVSRVGPPRTEAAACLLGLPEGLRLDVFGRSIGARYSSWADLPLLDRCREYALVEQDSVDERIALVRLLGHLSPRPGEGPAVKERAITRLAQMIPIMSASDINKLRNMDLAAFPGVTTFWDALGDRIASAEPHRDRDDLHFSKVLAAACQGDDGSPWRTAVLKGIDRAVAEGTRRFAGALWSCWQRELTLVDPLTGRIPTSSPLATSLADTCPVKISLALGEAILAVAASRGWLLLHGVVAGAAFDVPTAVSRQLAVDRGEAHLVGLKAIFRNHPERAVVESAVRTGERRLLSMAAEACAADHSLLRALEPDNAAWLAIWDGALTRDPLAWAGPADPQAVFARLIGLDVAGSRVPPSLWTKLAAMPAADLLDHPDRGTLWRRLSPAASSVLLQATASRWLERFANDAGFDPEVEPEVRAAVLQEPRIGEFLRRLSPRQLGLGTELFRRFGELIEARFEVWFDGAVLGSVSTRTIGDRDAAMIGGLVRTRVWRRTASKIASSIYRGNRRDLALAFIECQHLVGAWDRIRVAALGGPLLAASDPDDLWHMLEDLAVELYPSGPSEQSLWTRAGGTVATLRHSGSGQELWREALGLIRRGGGKVSAGRLLGVMRSDYSEHEGLSWLAGRDEFRERLP